MGLQVAQASQISAAKIDGAAATVYQPPSDNESQRFDLQSGIADYFTQPAVLRTSWFPGLAMGTAAGGTAAIAVAMIADGGWGQTHIPNVRAPWLIGAGMLVAGAAIGGFLGAKVFNSSSDLAVKMGNDKQHLDTLGGSLPRERFNEIRDHQ